MLEMSIKNVLPLKIAFLYFFAWLKPHLRTKYMHSFAIGCDRLFRTAIVLKSVDRCLLGQLTVGDKDVTAVERGDQVERSKLFC